MTVVRLLRLDQLVCRQLAPRHPGAHLPVLARALPTPGADRRQGQAGASGCHPLLPALRLDHTTRFLQYISHNAYIYVAVHDLTFTEGARQAFELTLRNTRARYRSYGGRAAPADAGELAVACTCTGGAAIVMSIHFSVEAAIPNATAHLPDLRGDVLRGRRVAGSIRRRLRGDLPLLPHDQEENDGDVRPYYASPTLQRYMEKHRPSLQLPAAARRRRMARRRTTRHSDG